MKRVLVADDEASLRLLVRTTLEDSDLALVEARDGQEALELALSTRPDLILLDWAMPRLSGPEVLRELKARVETARIPVIMITARSRESDRQQCLEAGATTYLSKPFSPTLLREQVYAVLQTAS